MSRCKSCNAEIIWAETDKGKRIPIDSEPCKDGNIMLVLEVNRPPHAQVHTIKARGIPYFKSHFATCPNARRHRKHDIRTGPLPI